MAGVAPKTPTNLGRLKSQIGHSRRGSTGSLPRYLLASTGSCHDFCKYGIKHDSEIRERSSITKRPVVKLDRFRVAQETKTESEILVKSKKKSILNPERSEKTQVVKKKTNVKNPKTLEKPLSLPIVPGHRRRHSEIVIPKKGPAMLDSAKPVPNFKNSKVVPPSRNPNGFMKPKSRENVPEKTLYVVVEPKPVVSKGTNVPKEARVKAEFRRTKSFSLEEKDFSPRKLKFRSVRAVDSKSESSSPIKLAFRRQKEIEDYPNGGAEEEGIELKRAVLDLDSNSAETEHAKVVLRHQDVEEKERSRDLFNNVIAETASKLVRTRKSKVKALVGAFETVISLQDAKSSAPVTP